MTVVRPAPCNWLISSSSCCSSWVWYWLTAAVRTVDAAVFCVLPLGKSSDSKSSNIAITPTVTASAVILAHNHPSGVGEPSHADQALTDTLKKALALVDVRVLDHFIVAGNAPPVSFAERGLL